MSLPDYYNNYNGLAATQCSEDFLITYCLTLTFILFCAFLLFTCFKDSILWILHTGDNIHHITLYTVHIFNTLFGLYTILNELWQLQPYDERFQQPGTQKVLTQIPTLLEEFITEVREQLTVSPSAEQTSPIQEIQQECCDSQVLEAEQFFSHTPHVFIERMLCVPNSVSALQIYTHVMNYYTP